MALEIGDVVAVVFQRRGEDRHQPEAGHAQVAQVVQFLGQAAQIAVAVAVAVVKAAHVDFVEDGILVPKASVLANVVCFPDDP